MVGWCELVVGRSKLGVAGTSADATVAAPNTAHNASFNFLKAQKLYMHVSEEALHANPLHNYFWDVWGKEQHGKKWNPLMFYTFCNKHLLRAKVLRSLLGPTLASFKSLRYSCF